MSARRRRAAAAAAIIRAIGAKSHQSIIACAFPTLQADLRKEEAQLNDDISVLTLIPVLSFGFSIKF